MNTETTNAALSVRADRYPVLNPALSGDALNVITENLGGSGIQLSDLARVVVPGSGGTTWSVPGLDGDQDTKEIVGIIVYTTEQNAFWSKSIDDSPNSPPDCWSKDGRIGIGIPGGSCRVCAKKLWKSDSKGRGKACRDMRPLFVLTDGKFIPMVISTPKMSLSPLRKYLNRLTGAGIPYYGVITKFTLKQEKNMDGIKYAEMVFSMVERLSADEINATRAYKNILAPLAEEVTMQTSTETPNHDDGGYVTIVDAPSDDPFSVTADDINAAADIAG